MVFLHTSDWHLGMPFKGRSSEQDQRFFIDKILEIIKERKVDALLVAGDIFDRSMANSEAVSLYDDIMTKIVVESNTPVHCVAGNHDSAERLSQCHELLKKAGLYVAGSLTKDFMIAECEDTDVYFLPWFSIDKVKAVFPEHAEEVNSMEAGYKVVIEEMKKTFKKGKKHFLITHAYITDAETSTSDRAAEMGKAAAVNMGVFNDFDYVALGHIHKPQVIKDNIRYCGSPMVYSFGKEETQEKGVILIDTKDMSKEFVPLEALHKRTTITGTYDEILAADYPEDVRTGYTRLEVTDEFVGPEALARFSEIYPLLLELKGKDYSEDGAEITLTIDELEEKSKDPEEIFKSFCDESKLEYTKENLDLFREVLNEMSMEAE